jgi:hypothetical protein
MQSKSSKFTSPADTQNLPPPPQETQESNCLELDHTIGYNGRYLKTIHFHPKNPDFFVYCIGGLIVLEDINDRHKQDFLRGHDMSVMALAISNSGFFFIEEIHENFQFSQEIYSQVDRKAQFIQRSQNPQ